MSTFYHFGCNTPNAELRAVIQYALDVTRGRKGRWPIAVHMHPGNIQRFIAIHGDWPAHWPKLIENEGIDTRYIATEVAPDRDSPQQLRLI